MAEDLAQMSCEECPHSTPCMTDEEIRVQRKQTPGWLIASCDGIRQLEREYEFDNFTTALAFTNFIGALAEREGHYPELVTEWGNVRVNWWTPEIDGLHRNDFIMAAKTDVAYREFVSKRPGIMARGKKKKRLDWLEQLFEESPMMQKKLEQMRVQMQEQSKVEVLQRTLVNFVEINFPDLTEFAQKRAKLLNNLDALEALNHKLFAASDAIMARRLLESVPEQPI